MSTVTLKNIEEISKLPHKILIRRDISWKDITTIGIGSNIPFLAEPINDLALSELLKYCYHHQINVLPIGSGSCLIGMDDNFDGIVIRFTSEDFSKIKISRSHVTAGVSVKLYDFVKTCADNGLGGVAGLAGIPGTIGGSIRVNSGRLGVCMHDTVIDMCGFNIKGEPWSAASEEIHWEYRNTNIHENVIVTAVICKMNHVDKERELTMIADCLETLENAYPAEKNSGCVFKNPPSGHSAGKLIDISGCKGMRVGDAEVSHVHANFIINKGNATEADFLELAIKVRQCVLEKTGIYLAPKVTFADKKSKEKLIASSKRLKVTVLKGGDSHERDVSLISATGVAKSLVDAGYEVTELDITSPVVPDKYLKSSDVIFPVLHGGFGENGEIQKFLESKNARYVGSDSTASAIIIDKIKTKEYFIKSGINTPKSATLKAGDYSFPEGMELPVVVKPPTDGSTFGITIVKNMSQWNEAITIASADPSGNVLVEEYVEGYELTIGIFNGKALPIVHISYPGAELYDFDAKYTHKTCETVYKVPPDENLIPKDIQDKIREDAAKAYAAVGARDMSRVDVLLTKKTLKPYFLEINSIPGFTPSSLLPMAANAMDIPYIQLCSMLVQLAAKRE